MRPVPQIAPARRGLVCLALTTLLGLAACAPTQPLMPPPPPPPPTGGWIPPDTGTDVPEPSRTWQQVATANDQDRFGRMDAAWTQALRQARTLPGSGDLNGLGALIDPSAVRTPIALNPGDYRCRTVKLGSQVPSGGLGYTVYGWFDCRIETTANGLKFVKLTGSQRPSGLLFPDSSRRRVMLGSMALGDDPPANSYGRTPDRDIIAAVERIGPERWRLVIPWPQAESILDLIELVPTP